MLVKAIRSPSPLTEGWSDSFPPTSLSRPSLRLTRIVASAARRRA